MTKFMVRKEKFEKKTKFKVYKLTCISKKIEWNKTKLCLKKKETVGIKKILTT